jgi:hypothetical protein
MFWVLTIIFALLNLFSSLKTDPHDYSSFLSNTESALAEKIANPADPLHLEQEGYNEQIPDSVARNTFTDFQKAFDQFGERLDERLLGRAVLSDDRPFKSAVCCYPTYPQLTGDTPQVQPADLTATRKFIISR